MSVPVSTKWVLDAVGPTGRVAVESVYLIYCAKTGLKGSGWLHKSGRLITNEHVVQGCVAAEVLALSSSGAQVAFKDLKLDADQDLALLTPTSAQAGGLEMDLSASPEVGMIVHAWGHPLGYNGPAPLLSVGYLAGFSEHKTASGTNKHLVVNGAFNPGNSGGPLFASQSDKVMGVVVSKHAPLSEFHQKAIGALASNSSGVVFTYTEPSGKQRQFVESQLVADILEYFRNLTQVMIGEAIAIETLADFLKKNGIAP